MAAYVAACDDVSLDGLRRAVTQFLTGKVEGRNNGFVPTAPELAAQAGMWDAAIAQLNRSKATKEPTLVAYPIGELPPPPLVPLGPLSVDFGAGMIDMREMSPAEKDLVLSRGMSLPASDGQLSSAARRVLEHARQRKAEFTVGDKDEEAA